MQDGPGAAEQPGGCCGAQAPKPHLGKVFPSVLSGQGLALCCYGCSGSAGLGVPPALPLEGMAQNRPEHFMTILQYVFSPWPGRSQAVPAWDAGALSTHLRDKDSCWPWGQRPALKEAQCPAV